MSLYGEVAKGLESKGLIRTVTQGASGAIGSAIGGVFGSSPLGKAITDRATSAASQAMQGLANKYIPSKLAAAIGTGSGILGGLMNGDFQGAAIKGIDAALSGGLIDKALGGLLGGSGSMLAPSPLFGGISAIQAKQMVMESLDTEYCKKNLFMIEVGSPLGDFSQQFNLFCTELDYAPFTITGEKRKLGSATVDTVQSGESVEFRLTTLDDSAGTLKRWFAAHTAMAVHQDGTVGLPAEYAIRIKVIHGFITSSSNRGGYFDVGLFRPANLEVSLSRREDNLQELTMTFAQFDTFMTVV